jgi:hypothetical protein
VTRQNEARETVRQCWFPAGTGHDGAEGVFVGIFRSRDFSNMQKSDFILDIQTPIISLPALRGFNAGSVFFRAFFSKAAFS